MDIINKKSPICMYYQLKEILQNHICRNRLKIGDKLPSIRHLIKLHKVSLPVVRQAFIELEKDGIIEIIQGKGCFIRKLPSKKQTDSILFLLCKKRLDDLYYSKVFSGVEEACSLNKSNLVYSTIHESDKFKIEEAINRSSPNGIILSGIMDATTVTHLKTLCIPFVLAGDMPNSEISPNEYINVTNDNIAGAEVATKYLLDLGHRNILFINGPEKKHIVWKKRRIGFEKTIKKFNGSVNSRIFNCTNDSASDAINTLNKTFDFNNLPTAIFAASDGFAQGIYLFLNRHKISIPNDISVIGFDDIDLSKNMHPSLTTISLNIENLGKESFKALRSISSRQSETEKKIIVESKLIKRESCKNLNKEGKHQ